MQSCKRYFQAPLSEFLGSFRIIWVFLIISVFMISTSASALDITLAWDPNTESDIGGYRVHYGTKSRNYSQVIDAGNRSKCTVKGLSPGRIYYFALTAYDLYDNESGYSAELIFEIPPSPCPIPWLTLLLKKKPR